MTSHQLRRVAAPLLALLFLVLFAAACAPPKPTPTPTTKPQPAPTTTRPTPPTTTTSTTSTTTTSTSTTSTTTTTSTTVPPVEPAPVSGTIAIADGAAATNDVDVTLTFTFDGPVTELRVGDTDVDDVDWQPATESLPWTLPDFEGSHTIAAQFRGAEGQTSSVVSVDMFLDTTPPVITQVAVDDGATFDLNDDDIALGGDAVDPDGSGIASVAVTVDAAPGVVLDAVTEDDQWVRPIGAASAGTFTFTATATDRAGNTSAVDTTASFTGTVIGGTRLRSDVVELDPSITERLSSSTPATLTFSGDITSEIGAAAVVLGRDAGDEIAFARTVEDFAYDADEDITTVTGGDAGLGQLFSRLTVDTTAPVDGLEAMPHDQLSAAIAQSDCDTFNDNRSLGVDVDLPDISGTLPAPTPARLDARLDGGVAAYVDIRLDISLSWGGPTVHEFTAGVGVLVCGSLTVSSDTMEPEDLIDEWVGAPAGVTYDEARALFNPAEVSIGRSIGDLGEFIEPIPVGAGFFVEPSVDLGAELFVESGLSTMGSVDVAVGGTFSVDKDTGISADNASGVTVDVLRTSSSAGVGMKLTAGYGIRIGWGQDRAASVGATVTALEFGLGPVARAEATWENARIARTSRITSYDLSWCVGADVSAGVQLDLELTVLNKEWTVTVLDISDELAEAERCWPLASYASPSAPFEITTTALGDAVVGAPYETVVTTNRPEGAFWSVTAGQLPPGLTLDAGTGRIHGAATAVGSGTFTLTARDTFRGSDSATFTITTTLPPPPAPAPGAVDVATGAAFTCAVRDDGRVACVGSDIFDTLGNGAPPGEDYRTDVPQFVVGITDAVAISSANNHACALHLTGEVSCWGDNFDGQLGDGTTAARTAPVKVAGLVDAVDVSAGGDHTCAVRANGSVWCWGNNSIGQLGDGTNVDRSVAVQIPGLDSITAVAAGNGHTCAIRVGGSVWCWGTNFDGEVTGTGGSGVQRVPVRVPGVSASVVSAGDDHTCAVTAGNQVACWGDNTDGQLGDGTTADRTGVVTAVGLPPMSDVSAGSGYPLAGFTCALSTTGGVWCWGSNDNAQLGDGTLNGRAVPAQVQLPGPATSVRATGGGFNTHTCAVVDADVWCWGANFYGQLGAAPGGSPWSGGLTPVRSTL
jgi:alpha-tubulin suppressor-like RCC1 family protein